MEHRPIENMTCFQCATVGSVALVTQLTVVKTYSRHIDNVFHVMVLSHRDKFVADSSSADHLSSLNTRKTVLFRLELISNESFTNQ